MPSLPIVHPALAFCLALVTKTRHIRPLAKPATDKDMSELIHVAPGKHLGPGGADELVDQLAVSVRAGPVGVEFDFGVVGEVWDTEFGAVFVDDGHVFGVLADGEGGFGDLAWECDGGSGHGEEGDYFEGDHFQQWLSKRDLYWLDKKVEGLVIEDDRSLTVVFGWDV
jgi:hypothetical protein